MSNLVYKPTDDLHICKSFEIESMFIAICNPKRRNIIIGCTYKDPYMSVNKFHGNYLNNFLNKLSKEEKTIFLIGDFNIELLKAEQHVCKITVLNDTIHNIMYLIFSFIGHILEELFLKPNIVQQKHKQINSAFYASICLKNNA